MEKRWTIRGVNGDAMALVQDVSAATGETLGSLVTQAVLVWHAGLPDAAEDPDLVELQQQLSKHKELLGQLRQTLEPFIARS